MSSIKTPITLHADQEHDGLRTAVIFILIALFFASYWLVNALLGLDALASVRDYAVSVSCVLGVIVALIATSVVEKLLKRYWPSGRSITLDDDGFQAQFRRQNPLHFQSNGSMTRLNWSFNLSGYRRGGREKRLPAKWMCLACQLQQDDQRLIVYSYMPPRNAAVWLNESNPAKFQSIDLAEVADKSFSARVKMPIRPEITNEMLTGKDGRYWLAERNRWDSGLELTQEDFATFMQYLARVES